VHKRKEVQQQTKNKAEYKTHGERGSKPPSKFGTETVEEKTTEQRTERTREEFITGDSLEEENPESSSEEEQDKPQYKKQ